MKIRISPTPAQQRLIYSPSQFTALIGGVGSGKTYGGATKALKRSMETVCEGMMIAPTYRMLKDSTLRTFKLLAGDCIAEESKSDMRLTMANGSHILCRSAEDPDHLRGPSLNWAWLDEAAYMTEYIWPVTLGRLRDRAGQFKPIGFVTCTPKGMNWLYDVFVKQHTPEEGYEIIHTTTYDNRANLDASYIKNLEQGYSGKYLAQEIKGEFVAFEGLIYDMFDEGLHVWPFNQPMPVFVGYEYGLDYGYTNPTAITVHGIPEIEGDERDYDIQVEEVYEKGLIPQAVADRMLVLYEKYGRGRVWVDPSSPELIAVLCDNGIDAVPADNDVKTGIQKEQAALDFIQGKPGAYITSNCIHTKSELASYCWRVRGKGVGARFLDEPNKAAGNDHLMDARRYRRMGHVGGRFKLPVMVGG